MTDIVADRGIVPTLGGTGAAAENIRLMHGGAEAIAQANRVLIAAERDAIVGARRVILGHVALREVAGGAGHQSFQKDDQQQMVEPHADEHPRLFLSLPGWELISGRRRRRQQQQCHLTFQRQK